VGLDLTDQAQIRFFFNHSSDMRENGGKIGLLQQSVDFKKVH
jgi:hypothetical protein